MLNEVCEELPDDFFRDLHYGVQLSEDLKMSPLDRDGTLVIMGEYNRSKHGNRITIYYDPADPSQITQTKSLIIPLIIIAAGIGACVGGIVSGVNAIRRYNNMKAQEREWSHGK